MKMITNNNNSGVDSSSEPFSTQVNRVQSKQDSSTYLTTGGLLLQMYQSGRSFSLSVLSVESIEGVLDSRVLRYIYILALALKFNGEVD